MSSNDASGSGKRVIDDLLAGEDDHAQQPPKRTKQNESSPIMISDSEGSPAPQQHAASQATILNPSPATRTQDPFSHAGEKPWMSQEQRQQHIESVRRHHKQLLVVVRLLPENDRQVPNHAWNNACTAMHDAIIEETNVTYATAGLDFRLPDYNTPLTDDTVLGQLDAEYEIAKRNDVSLTSANTDTAAQEIVLRAVDDAWLRASAVVWLQMAPLIMREPVGPIMIRALSSELNGRVTQLLEAWRRFQTDANWGPAYDVGGDCLLRIVAVVVRGASRGYAFSRVARLRACLDQAKDMRTVLDAAPTQIGVVQPSASLRDRVGALLEYLISDLEKLMDQAIDEGIEKSSQEPERLDIVS